MSVAQRVVRWTIRVLAMAAVVVLAAGPARAEGSDYDEVIEDPELGPGAQADVGGGFDDDDGEVIVDPELSGEPAAEPSEGGFGSGGFVRSYELHGLYRSRLGIDIQWDNPREEVWEVQQVAQLEAILRHSETTRFALGLRARHGYFAWQKATVDAEPDRTLFDVLPVAGYVDTSPALGLHVRAGYQMHHLGRFDVLSASNVLSAFDLRTGPTTIPEANEVAQLALRADWDITAALSLRAVYLPFFLPHLVEVTEGDYALVPPYDSTLDADLAGLSPEDQRAARATYGYFRKAFSRTGRAKVTRSGIDAFAPAADLASPQGALRADLRGAAGELGITLVTALERVPVFRAPTVTLNADGLVERIDGQAAEFGRIWVAAIDGALPLGPIQLGAELSYTYSRSLYGIVRNTIVASDGTSTIEETFVADDADLAQLGLRAEWSSGSLLLATEGFLAMVINQPYADTGGWWLFEQGRYAFGGVALAAYALGDFSFELGAAALNGPTVYVQPRIAYEFLEHTQLELGAHVMWGAPVSPLMSQWSLGTRYDPIDQVFIGLRYGT